MSSKGSSVVAERRLRPLWDAIDLRQYKAALKLATSLLSKHPDSVYLLVLKALVLERMGKTEEAFTLCEQAKRFGPTDDLTLSTLQIVYQRLDHPEQGTLCYELACSKMPNNLELMLGLFNCYVRDFSFLKQQQVAMKMHKFFGEERFLLWAVCSIQLQVFCGNKDRTLLSLAEALLRKRLDTHGFEELEALLVFLNLLEHEGRYEAALDVLLKKSGDLFTIVTDKLKLEGKLLLLSCQYERAAEVFQEVLEVSPDDWATLLNYLDALLEVSSGDLSSMGNMGDGRKQSNCEPPVNSLSNEEVERRLQIAEAFIKGLQSKGQLELRRGPFLASVEIERRRFFLLSQSENCNCSNDNLQMSVVEYFNRFGYMVSFASDIQGYVKSIQRLCCDGFLERLRETCNEAKEETAVRCLQRKISLFQVQMQLGPCAAAADRGSLLQAVEFSELYVEGLKLSKDLDSQENLHGEEFVTLAVTSLIQFFLGTKHPGYVVEAIILLEFVLAVRKYSFQYKIMLISLYSTVFSTPAAFEWYKTMDVKNILIETFSHHMLNPLMRSMLWSELDFMLSETVKFHEDYAKEAADLVIVAYRHCNYSKVLEFVQFKDSLQHSHNLLLSKVEGNILQLSQKCGALDDVMLAFERLDHGVTSLRWGSDECLAALSFNEALETRPWWSPAPGESKLTEIYDKPQLREAMPWERDIKEEGLQLKDSWRRRVCQRCLLPRLLYLSIGAAGFKDAGDSAAKSLAEELKSLLEKYAQCLGLEWEKLQNLFVDISRVRSLQTSLRVDASDMFSLALFWASDQMISQSSTEGLGLLIDMTKHYIMELTGFANISDAANWNFSHANVVASWSSLPTLVPLVTEAFAWCSICLQSWLRCLQVGSKTGKKKKKGAGASSLLDAAVNRDRLPVLVELQRFAGAFCDHLSVLAVWLTKLCEELEGSCSRVYMGYLEGGISVKSVGLSDALPQPGMVFHALQSSINSADYLGERVSSVLQTWQPELIIDKVVNSQCETLRRLSGVLLSILKHLQDAKASI